jgi:light-regulated signal transduction histidine kinase (bacteriophytochrome)
VTLPLDQGTGVLLVVGGPVTPVFGADEVNRLAEYASAISAALDRGRLVDHVRESERSYRLLSEELERRVAARTAELEASNHELEAFSYTVSHDLRAPLRAIDGFARILLEEHAADLAETPARYLSVISNSAQDMGRLIDGLLTFARLNRLPLKRQSVDPAEVARKVVAQLEGEAAGRDLSIVVHEMPVVASDPTLLEQVYSNLVGNAVKFTRRTTAAQVEVGSTGVPDESGGPVYFVKDNGAGFEMQHAGKLFGVFQRLHRSEEFEGTGAGLAIVQRIVHRHGGRIWAEAEPNRGATFFFTLGDGT